MLGSIKIHKNLENISLKPPEDFGSDQFYRLLPDVSDVVRYHKRVQFSRRKSVMRNIHSIAESRQIPIYTRRNKKNSIGDKPNLKEKPEYIKT